MSERILSPRTKSLAVLTLAFAAWCLVVGTMVLCVVAMGAR